MTAVASRGLDKSHYQGEGESWHSLASRFHLTWGACKATEGISTVDSTFTWNRAGLEAANLLGMFYHYAHPELSVSQQVAHFLDVVEPGPGCYVLDVERGTSQTATNTWIKAWLKGVRKARPSNPLYVYMNRNYGGTATGAGLSKYCDGWWVAEYPGRSTWPTEFDPILAGNTTGFDGPCMWQWTDRFYGEYDADVSTLTAFQLSGGLMAITQADADLIVDTWMARQIPMAYPPATGSATRSAATMLAWGMQYGMQGRDIGATNAQALASLPADVKAALVAALTDEIVNVDVTVNGKAAS